MPENTITPDEPKQDSVRPATKKDQILALYANGIQSLEDLALITHSRPSYVSTVLDTADKPTPYFDLYTSTRKPMNAYSRWFAGRLGYRDEETAQHSVELIDHFYRQFETAGDRAGQHHALLMALTMFNRARWTGKGPEASLFREWLQKKLAEDSR